MPTSARAIVPKSASSVRAQSTEAAGIWPVGVAILLAAFYLAASIYIAAHRIFWFDELFTVYIARLPKVSTIWAALANGVDALPPTYYMLVRAFESMFGSSEVAARLPSALAMSAGLLLIFDCARRLTDGIHALIAFGVAAASFLPYYGFEARSYGVYFMLAALALWVWTYQGLSTRAQALLFGAVFFAGGCMHYYFMMCLVPYGLWELLSWKKGRLPSLKLIAGIVGCGLSLAAFSPFALAFSHKFGGGYWNRPTPRELQLVYMQIFPDGLLLLSLIVLWIALVRAEGSVAAETELPAMTSAEAIGWLSLAIPLAAYAIAVLKTNAFFSRYLMGVLPGVAVAFAVLMWRHFRRFRQVSIPVFLLLVGWGVGQELLVAAHPEKVEATGIRPFLDVQSALHVEGKRYFVFSAPMLYLAAHQYSGHPDECVLLLPSDFSHKPENGPDAYQHQRLEANLSQYHPLQFWTVDDLRRHASEVALVDPDERALTDLRRAGIEGRSRMAGPAHVYYLQ